MVQWVDNTYRPISFWSKYFNKPQRKYSTFDREQLALLMACRHFKEYLESQEVVAKTVHKPLVHALKCQGDSLSSFQLRHLNHISRLVGKLEYCKGAENIVAALSRSVDDEDIGQKTITQDINQVDFASWMLNPTMFTEAQENDKGLQAWIKNISQWFRVMTIILA